MGHVLALAEGRWLLTIIAIMTQYGFIFHGPYFILVYIISPIKVCMFDEIDCPSVHLSVHFLA